MKSLKITIVLIGYCITSMLYASQAQQKTAATASSSSSAAWASASSRSLSSAAAADKKALDAVAKKPKKQHSVARPPLERLMEEDSSRPAETTSSLGPISNLQITMFINKNTTFGKAYNQYQADDTRKGLVYLAAVDSLNDKLFDLTDLHNEAEKLKTSRAKADFYAQAARYYRYHVELYDKFESEKFILETRMLIQKSFAELHEKCTIKNSKKAPDICLERVDYWNKQSMNPSSTL